MSAGSALGISFSHRHAAWLGLDPRAALRTLLAETGVRRLRLSAYWDEIAPEPGRLDFAPLRPWLETAAEHGATVLMSVGLRAQRHPEFYPPPWLTAQHPLPHGAALDAQPRVVALLMLMLERVTAFLADVDAIDAWQVENEPFLPAAGRTVGWRFSPDLLAREIAVVRDADPRRRPIVVNHSSHTALDRVWRDALALGDVLAQNIYTRRPARRGLPWRYWNVHALGPLAPRLAAQSAAARRTGRQFWVTELQAEPWERDGSAALGDTTPSISPERLHANLALARRFRPARVYLWGAEWWLWRAGRGDRRYLDLAEQLFHADG